jgi:hypothetical protein
VRHQVAESPSIRPDVDEHHLHRLAGWCCGTTSRAGLPASVSTAPLGPSLREIPASFVGSYRLARRPIQRLAFDLSGLDVSLEMTPSSVASPPRPWSRLLPTWSPRSLRPPSACIDETSWAAVIEKAWLSGDPNDIFNAAENLGKVFSKLAEGALAPKKIIPTYKMLVGNAKPPVPSDQKPLAAHVSEHPQVWETLLKRPFHTLKADGPFIFDEAEVDAKVTDLLGSLGDPPTTLRLTLARFRLEGIDTAWRVIAARRVLPGDDLGDRLESLQNLQTSLRARNSPFPVPWAIRRTANLSGCPNREPRFPD